MTAPTTITGRMYRISDTEFEQTLKAYENDEMQPGIYKAVVHIWPFFLQEQVVCFFCFFSEFQATDKKLLSLKLELEITLPLRLSKGSFFLNF